MEILPKERDRDHQRESSQRVSQKKTEFISSTAWGSGRLRVLSKTIKVLVKKKKKKNNYLEEAGRFI